VDEDRARLDFDRLALDVSTVPLSRNRWTRFATASGEWELIDRKKPVVVITSGTALVTDTMQALSLALAGVGIAYVAEPLARRYLREGSLEWLLPQSATEYDGMFLYYPKRASLAPKLRVFIDVAKKTLKSFE
jgi:DNA-binding transcriptional LysR family regulator